MAVKKASELSIGDKVNGGDITIAQRMAGHANIKTTQVYDRREDEVSFSEIERVGI
jgi:site-specific recombinase XerC